ncbi:MAG TPA: nucleoside 2-deoxyribosyltransferase [Methanothrix sp.]|nr:nucleoside 2-deoxyribosyltransferase [Methanothrix sp.]
MEHKIYLSGPLFSQGEIAWAKNVLALLKRRLDCEIIWPHEIASGSMEQIFRANLNALDECDIMVAILDGSQVDDGTAWEVGYFFSQGKKILGIRTDLRRAGEFEKSKVNLMVECSCMCVAADLDQLCLELEMHLD